MDLEDVLVSVFVGFLLWCLYASMYERLKSKAPLLQTTVKL